MREWKLERARGKSWLYVVSAAAYLPVYPGTSTHDSCKNRDRAVVGKRSTVASEYRLVLTVLGYRQRGGHVYMDTSWRKEASD